MKYGSVCSGIEAASVAWESLGWEAQWYSEIEHFPSAVLAHRFPAVPNLGDMTKIHETKIFNDTTIDLLVGGTPCQSFSVAGLRKGLDDPRGNLMLTFLSLAQRKKPRWIVWENVPGVLSSNGGRDFATFLQALAECGYGFAYRVLDAQYFGVAQRRRRVFVVGYLGDWRPAGAVLFEQDCLSGNSKESRKKRKATSADVEGGSGGRGIPRVAQTLSSRDYKGPSCGRDGLVGNPIAVLPKSSELKYWGSDPECSDTVTSKWYKGSGGPSGSECGLFVSHPTHAFKVRGGSEDNTGEQGGTPGKKAGKGYLGSDELAFTIGTTQDQQIAQPIALAENTIGRQPMNGGNGDGFTEKGPMYTLNATGVHGVAQPVPFRKVRRAKFKGDFETWEQDEHTNTLNTFDLGDIRTTQAVVHPIAVDTYNQTVNENSVQTIRSDGNHTDRTGAVLTPQQQTMAVLGGQHPNAAIGENTCPTITSASGAGGGHIPLVPQQPTNVSPTITQCKGSRGGSSMEALDEISAIHAQQPTMAIRRLTPTECERLQGFPDGWTKIPYRNKPVEQCPDGPRYKACGNSMAVPVMRWIGERIEMVEKLRKELTL